jgi:hypothetical protein
VALSSAKSSDYTIVHALTNITQSSPYTETTDLDTIAIPTGNSTNVTLTSPVPAARYASLLIVGNQALDPIDVEARNGTGATVAEWAIIGQDKQSDTSSSRSVRRKMDLRDASALSDVDSFIRRKRQLLSLN